jgi:hypothetical protein
MDTVYFKKDIVSLNKAFNGLEKVRRDGKPTKKVLVLDQSNIHPDMINTIRNNNAFEDNFWKNHNNYKLTPHIDFKPKYTPPYYAPHETGYGSFNYQSYMQNLKMV